MGLMNILPRASPKFCHQSGLNVSFQTILANLPTPNLLLPIPDWALLSPVPWNPSTLNQIQLDFWNQIRFSQTLPALYPLICSLIWFCPGTFLLVIHPLPAVLFMLCLLNYTKSTQDSNYVFYFLQEEARSCTLQVFSHFICSPFTCIILPFSFPSWKSVLYKSR